MFTSSMVISLLSGLGGMFGWGLYDFFAGVYAKRIGPYKTFFWSQLVGGLVMIALAFLFAGQFNLSVRVVILLPVASLLYSGGYLFFMRGFEIGNIAIVAAVMNLWTVFTMLNAYLFFGQRLSALQFAGVLMIIAGAVVASIKWNELMAKRVQPSAGVKETVIGALFFGAFWNVSEILSEQIGWLHATLGIKVGIVLTLLLFSFLFKQKIYLRTVSVRTKYVIALMGLIEAGAIAVVNYGLTIGDAILITPIASALSVVTILMAVVFLKEKVSKMQIAGICTAVLGIVVTAF